MLYLGDTVGAPSAKAAVGRRELCSVASRGVGGEVMEDEGVEVISRRSVFILQVRGVLTIVGH